MGMGLSEKQLVDIIAAIDKDQDLELSYKELLAAVSPATVGLSLVATSLTVDRCWGTGRRRGSAGGL